MCTEPVLAPLQAFFSSRWRELARQMVHNFFSAVLPQAPLPTVLQLQSDRCTMQRSLSELDTLREENARLRQQLQAVADACDAGPGHERIRGAPKPEEGVEMVDMATQPPAGDAPNEA
jgi:hypothetical protein